MDFGERIIIQLELAKARRWAALYAPFSAPWDAAMARVEDLERRLWRAEHPDERVEVRVLVESRA